MATVYNTLLQQKQSGKKALAILIDPDKVNEQSLAQLVSHAHEAGASYFFVGGSLLTNNFIRQCIQYIKQHSSIPVVLFPGNPTQIIETADAILFLSLISGRNADMLIGHHVVSAPTLKQSGLEVISTGYMVIDGGMPTTVSYMSNATPIPANKNDIAVCTAMAGEMLGLKLIYMDAGSGAQYSVSPSMITEVRKHVAVPIIVGGGIRTPEQAIEKCKAGADVVVVGNIFEKQPELIVPFGQAVNGAF